MMRYDQPEKDAGMGNQARNAPICRVAPRRYPVRDRGRSTHPTRRSPSGAGRRTAGCARMLGRRGDLGLFSELGHERGVLIDIKIPDVNRERCVSWSGLSVAKGRIRVDKSAEEGHGQRQHKGQQ